ncbi:MAG: methionyl-tRNA formyltransferase [Gammaproteobacteria bacterium]|nr:methionyl-tRNA formyltransferase [Gammaproteobacteria bacterium]
MPGIVFAGTPDFARQSLVALIESGHVPALVLTQPDRPSGRGRKIRPGPVKQLATEHGITVREPLTLRDEGTRQELRELAPDVMIVAAYGLLLPQNILDIPRVGCVNVHASLLPRWRGAAPIQAAILAGDTETGISLMQMEAGLDSGPVFARASLEIGRDEAAGELHDRLAVLGGEMLATHLPAILDGSLEPEAQNEAAVTYAPKIRSSDAAMHWQRSASYLARHVRAYNPVPGAYFDFHGERIKCWAAEAIAGQHGSAGQMVDASSKGIDIACAEGTLRMVELQRPGRNRVSAREFAAQLATVDPDVG